MEDSEFVNIYSDTRSLFFLKFKPGLFYRMMWGKERKAKVVPKYTGRKRAGGNRMLIVSEK